MAECVSSSPNGRGRKREKGVSAGRGLPGEQARRKGGKKRSTRNGGLHVIRLPDQRPRSASIKGEKRKESTPAGLSKLGEEGEGMNFRVSASTPEEEKGKKRTPASSCAKQALQRRGEERKNVKEQIKNTDDVLSVMGGKGRETFQDFRIGRQILREKKKEEGGGKLTPAHAPCHNKKKKKKKRKSKA